MQRFGWGDLMLLGLVMFIVLGLAAVTRCEEIVGPPAPRSRSDVMLELLADDAKERRRELVVMTGAEVLCHGFDLWTTERALRDPALREGVMVFGDTSGKRLLVKSLWIAGVTLFTRELLQRDQRKAAWIVTAGSCGWAVGFGVSNLSKAR